MRSLKIKSIKPHTNFAEEIYQQEKADKFLDAIFLIGCVIAAILAVALIAINVIK